MMLLIASGLLLVGAGLGYLAGYNEGVRQLKEHNHRQLTAHIKRQLLTDIWRWL